MRAVLTPALLGVLVAPVLISPSSPPLSAAGPPALTASERATLVRSREEEKLSRDLYRALGEVYPDVMPFQHIPHAEQRHMDAVGSLLTAYGVPDPVGRNAPGVFRDPEIQQRYTELVARGRTSKAAAAQRARLSTVAIAWSGWRPAARSTSSAMTLPEPSQMALSGDSRKYRAIGRSSV